MQFAVLFCLVGVVSAIEFRSKSFNSMLMPKGWHSMRPVESTGGVSLNYMIMNIHGGSLDCTGPVTGAQGLAYDTCFVGYDESGTIVGSTRYRFGGSNPSTIYYNVTSWSTPNCQWPITSTEIKTYQTQCFPSEADNAGMNMQYNITASPWTALGKGVAINDYDSENNCRTNFSVDKFEWMGLNTCMQMSTSDNESVQSAMVTSCTNAGINYNVYKDTKCEVLLESGTKIPPPSCNTVNEGSEFPYTRQFCT